MALFGHTLSPPLSLATPGVFAMLRDFAFSRTSYKWKHTPCSLLCLASSTWHNYFNIYTCCVCQYFGPLCCWAAFHWMYAQASLGFWGALVPGSLWILKSEDTQVPYVKWHSICLEPMHILPYTVSSMDYLQSSQVVLVVKHLPANAGDCRFHPWVWKLPWCRQWQPTSVFLPGKSHGQRRLAGYSPWDFRELDTTGHAHTYTHTKITCNICNI